MFDCRSRNFIFMRQRLEMFQKVLQPRTAKNNNRKAAPKKKSCRLSRIFLFMKRSQAA